VKTTTMTLLTTAAAAALFLNGALVAEPLPSAPWLQEGETPAAESDADADEEKEVWVAVTGGDVYTGTGALLRGATIAVKDGVIVEIGFDPYLPDDATHYDVTGYRVYPGLVALGATARVTQGRFAIEDPTWAVDPDSDPDAWMDAFDDEDGPGPTFDQDGFKTRLVDSYDPFSPFMTLALANGITTVEQSGASFKLKRAEIDGVVMNEDAVVGFNMRNGAARTKTDEVFAAAEKFLRETAAWERRGRPKGEEPNGRGVDQNALRVLRNEVGAQFDADNRTELYAIAKLAQKYGFRPIIQGAREGWIVASELGRAGAIVVLEPRDRRWNDPESLYQSGTNAENAGILHRAGCQIALRTQSAAVDTGGIAGRDLLSLNLQAGYAVRAGLSNEDALAAITIVPARILGIDHRVGTIEVGKDADLLVTKTDILHYETLVELAFVGGELAYDKSQELFYAHIRPQEILKELEAEAAEAAAAEEAAAEETPAAEEAPATEEAPAEQPPAEQPPAEEPPVEPPPAEEPPAPEPPAPPADGR